MSSMSVLMFRRLRQVSARDGRNPRMNRHLNEVDNGRHAREERRRSGPRGAISKVYRYIFVVRRQWGADLQQVIRGDGASCPRLPLFFGADSAALSNLFTSSPRPFLWRDGRRRDDGDQRGARTAPRAQKVILAASILGAFYFPPYFTPRLIYFPRLAPLLSRGQNMHAACALLLGLIFRSFKLCRSPFTNLSLVR